jgi:hypothetical protein
MAWFKMVYINSLSLTKYMQLDLLFFIAFGLFFSASSDFKVKFCRCINHPIVLNGNSHIYCNGRSANLRGILGFFNAILSKTLHYICYDE